MQPRATERHSDMTDRQLIEAYAGGHDLQAFSAFVDRHQSALLSFASAFLRDDSLAQDIVQEVFLRAARDPGRILKFKPDGHERNWLLKVVRDLSVDSLRRKASERKALDKIAQTTPETAASAEANAEQAEEAQSVRTAIGRLKPRLQELLILKIQEQKTYREIAQITGLSVTNVGFLLHQAMEALAQELKQVRSS